MTSIPVVLAADENYFTPLTVTIKSILKNGDTNSFFDFRILTDKEYSKSMKEVLTNISDENTNCSIIYVNMSEYASKAKSRIPHISKATFYRLWVADILHDVEKCIYLDVDVVVTGDITELYNTDLCGCYMGG